MIKLLDYDIRCDPIEVTNYLGHTKPDPAWSFTDASGHQHAWVGDELPTLTRHQDPEWIDADGDEHNGDVWWTCRSCDEEVEPTTIYVPSSGFREFVPGHVYGTVTFESDMELPDDLPVEIALGGEVVSARIDRLSVIDGTLRYTASF